MSNLQSHRKLLGQYRTELEGLGRARGTITLRCSHVRRALEYIDKPVEQIGRADLMGWLAANDWGAPARASARASLQNFWAWLAANGLCADVAKDIPRPRQPRAVPRPANDDDILQALRCADSDIQLAIEIMASTGLRRAECARIKSSDLTYTPAPYLRVIGKGGHERFVPVPAFLAKKISARGGWLFPGNDSGHISPGWLGKRIGRALPPGVTPHMLRHRYATTVYRNSGDLRAVQHLLGHASVATTQVYVALGTDQIEQAARTAWQLAS